MKISKLFHWLYAFLMFLPIVLFIPNAFYYGFNEHATNSETTTINYKYQSNEVNSLDDLVEGNIYHFEIDNNTLDSIFDMAEGSYFSSTFININNYDFINYDLELDDFLGASYENNGIISVGFNITDYYDATLLFYLTENGNNDYFVALNLGQLTDEFSLQGDFILNDINVERLNINPFSYTVYNVIESVEINTDDTISNKMYQAWQSTWDLPLLQWTHTSFVAQPFTYITGLFGVPSDSSFNYVFAYFVSISICWLVFDLIMYVPNLAHRWLDKGALE